VVAPPRSSRSPRRPPAPSPSVARATDPEAIQELAYAAAVEELRKRGVPWTEDDSRKLRKESGIEGARASSEARAEIAAFVREMGYGTERASSAVQRLLDAATRHPKSAVLCSLAEAARHLQDLAEDDELDTTESERTMIVDYARTVAGWWDSSKTRDLALLSVLAGAPEWRSSYEPGSAGHPGAITGKEAIGKKETRSMNGAAKRAAKKRSIRARALDTTEAEVSELQRIVRLLTAESFGADGDVRACAAELARRLRSRRT